MQAGITCGMTWCVEIHIQILYNASNVNGRTNQVKQKLNLLGANRGRRDWKYLRMPSAASASVAKSEAGFYLFSTQIRHNRNYCMKSTIQSTPPKEMNSKNKNNKASFECVPFRRKSFMQNMTHQRRHIVWRGAVLSPQNEWMSGSVNGKYFSISQWPTNRGKAFFSAKSFLFIWLPQVTCFMRIPIWNPLKLEDQRKTNFGRFDWSEFAIRYAKAANAFEQSSLYNKRICSCTFEHRAYCDTWRASNPFINN